MVTHQQKDGNPPKEGVRQTWNLAFRLNSQTNNIRESEWFIDKGKIHQVSYPLAPTVVGPDIRRHYGGFPKCKEHKIKIRS